MKKELVNLHAGLCTLWVDHGLLEPEIPMHSLAIVSQTTEFVGDGIYAFRTGETLDLRRCNGYSEIAISNAEKEQSSQIGIDSFRNLVFGRLLAYLKLGG